MGKAEDAIRRVTRQGKTIKLPVGDVWMTAAKFYELRKEPLPAEVLPEDVVHWDGKTAHFEDDCEPGCIRLG